MRLIPETIDTDETPTFFTCSAFGWMVMAGDKE